MQGYTTFIDFLSPEQEFDKSHVSLWRAVLLRVMRDSCDRKEDAAYHARWALTNNCKEVCSHARIEYTMLRDKLISIHESEKERAKTFESMTYFKSKLYQYKEKKK